MLSDDAKALVARVLESSVVTTEDSALVRELIEKGILRPECQGNSLTRRSVLAGSLGIGAVVALSLPDVAVASSEEVFLPGNWFWEEWGTDGNILDGSENELIIDVRFFGEGLDPDLNGDWDLTLDPGSRVVLRDGTIRLEIENEELDRSAQLNTAAMTPLYQVRSQLQLITLTGTMVSTTPGGPSYRVRFIYD